MIKTETVSDERKEKEEKSKEDGSSPDAVSVHVEAALGAVELLLYSDIGEVAEVKVRGIYMYSEWGFLCHFYFV